MAQIYVVLVTICWLLPVSLSSPTCPQDAAECEFTLVVNAKLTMMWGKVLTYPFNGSLYEYTTTDPATTAPVPTEQVITMDGWESPRLVILVNGTIPGPPIEVWENQMIRVHVQNKLHNEGIAVHWHGFHQMGYPHMDGVPFVTQCPILPGQTFTYYFRAHPRGTHWYHSHLGSQRTMGFYGPLIVHPRETPTPQLEELTWMVSDWNHEYDSEVTFYKMIYGIYEGRSKYEGTKSLDGASFSLFRFHSGILNGRGRYYDENTGVHNGAPLSKFTVIPGHHYRVRVICAGELYPFRISVNDHLLTIIASDGFDIEPVTVESFVINPGERFDFILNATQPIANYWIHGETLEVDVNHTLEAVLHYEGAPSDVDPVPHHRHCTEQEKCVVVNCPFKYYPPEAHTVCLTFDQLRASVNVNLPTPSNSPDKFEELFMNFAFPGENWAPGSVNGRVFEAPGVAALTQGNEVDTFCEEGECGQGKVCKCTWAYPVDHGKTYQFVLLNMGKGKGWAHPIHMHGHSFHVVKMGFPITNSTTAKIVGDNTDIDCRGNPDPTRTYCNSATWADPSWFGGNIPGLELERPPIKDTLIVPSGGYAVVRIEANNPGLWILHCHIQIHSMGGMAMLLNESPGHVPSAPINYPECRSFVSYADDQEIPRLDTNSPPSPSTSHEASSPATTYDSSSTYSPSPTSRDDHYPSSVSDTSSSYSSQYDSESSSTNYGSSSPSSSESSYSPDVSSRRQTPSSTSYESSTGITRSIVSSDTPMMGGSDTPMMGGSDRMPSMNCPPPSSIPCVTDKSLPPTQCTGFSAEIFWAVTGCLVIFIVLLLLILLVYMCLYRTTGGRSKTYKLDSTNSYHNKGAAL